MDRVEVVRKLQQSAEEHLCIKLIDAGVANAVNEIADLATWFSPKFIADPWYRDLATAVFSVSSDGKPVSAYTLAAAISKQRRFADAPLQGVVDMIHQGTGTTYGLRTYAKDVIEYHRRRTLSQETGDASQSIRNGADIDPIIQQLSGSLNNGHHGPESRINGNAGAFERILNAMEGKVEPMTLGIPSADEKMKILPGQIIVCAARTSGGKSVLLSHVTMHLVTHGKTVLFFTLEMSPDSVYTRMACWAAQVAQTQKREFVGGLSTVQNLVKEGKIQVFSNHRTIDQIERACQSYCRRSEVTAIVVDYLQLVRNNTKGIDSREQQVADVTRRLKGLATDHGVVLLTASQLNRSGAERPTLASLRESGSIEQDADAVLLMKPDGDDDITKLWLSVAKNRDGPTGAKEIIWNKPRFRFYEQERRFDGQY